MIVLGSSVNRRAGSTPVIRIRDGKPHFVGLFVCLEKRCVVQNIKNRRERNISSAYLLHGEELKKFLSNALKTSDGKED